VNPPRIVPPRSKEELVSELRRVEAEARAWWDALPLDEFLAPQGAAWSPADNVRHLVKSQGPVTLALGLPRLLLRVLFGSAPAPSRDLPTLQAAYAAVLAAGGQAGRYAPRPAVVRGDPAAWRQALMARSDASGAALVAAALPWTERDLDRLRLPHPLLGPLTVREMLLFTLYHTIHHVENVSRRRAAAP
jgi:hypothetical protein